ncbi:hypothetical protein Pcinc_023826 [Petrolisthes cinctipes]|uniref:Uncharacterized protein n=1 Tax=Petrolisthes cinctipes TaxID=88211 RepID=A0AAE1FE79_PETCI|nr:hypothetical protein Pcinc_023826 [Petrolisthes cinctipes]
MSRPSRPFMAPPHRKTEAARNNKLIRPYKMSEWARLGEGLRRRGEGGRWKRRSGQGGGRGGVGRGGGRGGVGREVEEEGWAGMWKRSGGEMDVEVEV